ncbi:NADH-quinone oxidoreductase subunit J family protein [Bremerella sp. T1]|uniref:NADH-quinone oxidoreductase subunit J family protein n=1 Tax=Bremerella sp. TYQ1 TaxID=3119568 RepID=UPI001CCD0D7A|nr:NADH-quinone oxidoreductase subunit J [Bremerella volcania]UBM35241.1 NADH-quinone oxidoreductase subunit J [Bremerella volcania]
MISLLAATSEAAINWHTVLFYVVSLCACGFAVIVATTNNIVRMAFALIVSLAATSALLFLAGAYFVGAMQLMIYVGGTVVLLIFGVMLTAQKAFITMRTKAGDWVLGLLVGGTFLAVLVQLAFLIPQWQSSHYQTSADEHLQAYAEELKQQVERGEEVTAEQKRRLEGLLAKANEGMPQRTGEIGLALLGVRADKIESDQSGLSGYLLPFEIVSVHLLVVLVGAAYLARAKRHHQGGGH